MPTDKELLDAFSRLSQAWDIERSGIIVTFNGARVATWNWNKARMLINPENDDFRELFRRLNKDGVLKRIPSKRLGKEPVVDNTILVGVPVSQSTPGELDHMLKNLGFYVIDLNVPVVKD